MDGRLDMSLRALESSSIVLSEKYRVHGVIFTRNIRNIDLINIEFQEIRNKKVWIFHFFMLPFSRFHCSNVTDFILCCPRALMSWTDIIYRKTKVLLLTRTHMLTISISGGRTLPEKGVARTIVSRNSCPWHPPPYIRAMCVWKDAATAQPGGWRSLVPEPTARYRNTAGRGGGKGLRPFMNVAVGLRYVDHFWCGIYERHSWTVAFLKITVLSHPV